MPRESIAGNVNTDMFLPLFPLKTLMVLGLDESDLGGDIRAAATAAGIGVQADPEPQRNRFVRSDQYSFIKVGIPALAMKVGYEPGSPQAAVAAKWTADRYHAPSDDLNQPIDLSAAGRYVDILRDLLLAGELDLHARWPLSRIRKPRGPFDAMVGDSTHSFRPHPRRRFDAQYTAVSA